MKHLRLTIVAGVVAGLVFAGVVLLRRQPAPPAPPTDLALTDCDGAISTVILQYIPDAADISPAVYAAFVANVPRDITVHVVCDSEAAFIDFLQQSGIPQKKLVPLFLAHKMSTWSRDRWVGLAREDGGFTLLAPRGEDNAEEWPQRAGDAKVTRHLGLLLENTDARYSALYFDGGDFVVDSDRAYVTPRVLSRNLQKTVQTRDELIAALEAELGRPVLLLDRAPDHHAGMFMMPISEGRVMVADPSLAFGLMDPAELDALFPDGADRTPETQALFDAVAAQLTAAGIEVIRAPTAPGADGRAYLAYLNVILNERQGQRFVYMPTYQGADALNATATQVWQDAGYTVLPVDCTSAYRHGGSLRCLVNIPHRK